MSAVTVMLIFFAGLGLFLLMLVGLFAAGLHEEKLPRRAETLKRLAVRWMGESRTGYLASEHGMRFTVDGVPAALSFDGGGPHPRAWTRLQFDAPVRRRLSVAPQGFLTRFLRGEDLHCGDPRFDDAFIVASSDEGWAREALDADLRGRLVSLREQGFGFGRGNLALDIGPAGVALRAQAALLDEPAILEAFVEAGVRALWRALGTRGSEGIALADVGTSEGSACLVCGHVVEGGRACPQCCTPHHEDCWTYTGGCARFACGGRAS